MLDIIYNADISPWGKPVGKIPTLARYQALMGLKPFGRHITLAEPAEGHHLHVSDLQRYRTLWHLRRLGLVGLPHLPWTG